MNYWLFICGSILFLLALWRIRCIRNTAGFTFHQFTAKQVSLSWLFYVFIAVYLVCMLGGIFFDRNISIMEATDLSEVAYPIGNIIQFLFSGSKAAHQHLYELIVLGVSKVVLLDRVVNFFPEAPTKHFFAYLSGTLLIARGISLLFGLGSVFLFKKLLAFFPIQKGKHIYVLMLFAVFPVNVFYFTQAEPYAMLLFTAVLNMYFFFSLGQRNLAYNVCGFALTFFLGYFTHLYFLLVFVVESLFVLYLEFFKKKTVKGYYYALVCIIPFVTYLLQNQVNVAAFQSPIVYFIDGYFKPDFVLIVRYFCACLGFTNTLFGKSFLWLLFSVFLLGGFVVKSWKGTKNNESILFLYFLLFVEMTVFFIFNFIMAAHGFTYVVVRHYIVMSLAVVLLLGIGLENVFTLKQRWLELSILILLLGVYCFTDYRMITQRYKPDFHSMVRYIRQGFTNQQNLGCMNVTSWLNFYGPLPWIFESYAQPNEKTIERIYFNSQLLYHTDVQYQAMPSPLFESAESNLNARQLLGTIFQDQYIWSYDQGRSPVELLNIFLMDESVTSQLQRMAIARNINISCCYGLLQQKQKMTRHGVSLTSIKNRVLLELIYSRTCPKKMLACFDRTIKIYSIVKNNTDVDFFILPISREQIFGFEHVDIACQYEALTILQNMPQMLVLHSKKSFQNLEVYVFQRKI